MARLLNDSDNHIPLPSLNKLKKMQNKLSSAMVWSLLLLFSSCQVIGGIFKAGVWVGVLLVVGIVGLIIFLISKFSNKN
jgi:hypothetical protein